jgi:hypothetical protein
MNTDLSRRKFIKAGILGAGTVLTWTIFTDDVLAGGGSRVRFSTKKAKGGCTRCEKAIAEMLKDKDKRAEIENLFPAKSKVVFYVRRQKYRTRVAENAIAVGHCARALRSKADVFVNGCTKQINSNFVYKTIIAKLGKKEEK